MTTIKTQDLTGAALDWAVAQFCYPNVTTCKPIGGKAQVIRLGGPGGAYSPSTDWSQGGPLIEKYDVEIERMPTIAICDGKIGHGDAPRSPALTAACRAIVAAKLGDEVDVPEELV